MPSSVGRKNGVSDVFATARGHAEVVTGEKLHPALDVWFGFSDITNLLEVPVVGRNRKHAKYVASQAMNAPDNASSF